MITRTGRQSGFGLVELTIGIAVGLIVVAAAMSLLSTTMASSNDNIKMTRLDQELRQVMSMLSRDVRRATSWDPAADVVRVSLAHPLTLTGNTGDVTVTSSTGNLGAIGAKAVGGTLVYPAREYDAVTDAYVVTVYQGTITAFDSGTKSYSVTIGSAWPASVTAVDGVPAGGWGILRPESSVTTDASCLLIVYDTDASGTYTNYSAGPPETPSEFFGYRYDSTDKVVETRTSGTGTCAAGGTGWENLTDSNTVEITDFSITDNSPDVLCGAGSTPGFFVAVRELTVSITGQLKADPSVVRTLQETIRVRNDNVYVETPPCT